MKLKNTKSEKNVLDSVEKILSNKKIDFNLFIPNKMHQLNFQERQISTGIEKKFMFYNNTTNDQLHIKCILKNDYYSNSEIFIKVNKTNFNLNSEKSDYVRIYQGKNIDTNQIFTSLKSVYYDSFLKIPVPVSH